MARNPELNKAISEAQTLASKDGVTGDRHVTMTVAQLEAVLDRAMTARLDAHAQSLGMKLPPMPDKTLPTMAEAVEMTRLAEEAGKAHASIETQEGWYVGPFSGIPPQQWNGGGVR